MPLLVEKKSLAKIGNKIEASRTSPKSPTGTIIRKDIIPLIVLNFSKQKNSYSLNDLHIDNYK